MLNTKVIFNYYGNSQRFSANLKFQVEWIRKTLKGLRINKKIIEEAVSQASHHALHWKDFSRFNSVELAAGLGIPIEPAELLHDTAVEQFTPKEAIKQYFQNCGYTPSKHANFKTPFGYDRKIYDRKEAAKILEDSLALNYNRLGSPHMRDHVICSSFGFSGIGKTALGLSIAKDLLFNRKPVVYVYVDFSMAESMKYEPIKSYKEFRKEISLRIIPGLFQGITFYGANSNHPHAVDRLRKFAPSLSLKHVLQLWVSQQRQLEDDAPLRPILFHFDSLNSLNTNYWSWLVTALEEAMDPSMYDSVEDMVTILPLITGSNQSMKHLLDKSSLGHTEIHLTPLHKKSQIEMVLDFVPEGIKDITGGSPMFHNLVKSTLGVPRVIVSFKEKFEKIVSVDQMQLTDLLLQVTEKFEWIAPLTYNVQNWIYLVPGEVALLQFIGCVLRGQLVQQESLAVQFPGVAEPMKCLPAFQLTIQYLMDAGYICNNGDTILLPYVLLVNFIKALHGQERPSFKNILFSPLAQLTNQSLDMIEPHFVVLLVNCFNAMQNNSIVQFADIWKGSITSATIKSLKINIPSNFSVIQDRFFDEKKNKISSIDINASYIGANRSLFDVRYVFDLHCQLALESNEVDFQTEQIGRQKKRKVKSSTSKNKRLKQSKKLVNLVHMKSLATSMKVKASNVFEWYSAANKIKLPKGAEAVFTYYINQHFEYDEKEPGIMWTEAGLLAACPRLALMSQENLDSYLSPTFSLFCKTD